MTRGRAEQIIAELWAKGRNPVPPDVYVVLDGARDERIEPLVSASRMLFTCLYSGTLSPRLRAAAPYLVQLQPQAPFTRELLERAWGLDWGCFARVDAGLSLDALRKHLRTLLRVKDEFGKTLVFRYYDPRVLRTYLPTCTPEELNLFLGPVRRICVEGPGGGELLSYSRGLLQADLETVPLPQPAPTPTPFSGGDAVGGFAL